MGRFFHLFYGSLLRLSGLRHGRLWLCADLKPVLAFFIPVSHIVPMLALMDLGAAVINVTRDGRKADFAELKWMVPLMIGGSLIGAAILLKTHPDLLAVFLGAFIVLYALYSSLLRKLCGITRRNTLFRSGSAAVF